MKSTLLKTLLCGSVSLVLGASAGAQTVLRQGSNSPPGTVYHRQGLDAVRAENERIVGAAAAEGLAVHRSSPEALAALRAVGEKSTAAVMATLPPEAAQLRDQLRAQVQQAPR